MGELSEKIFVKFLTKLASPFLEKGKYLKIPKNKKKRFIFIFMIAMMIVSLFYLWLLGTLEDFSFSLISRLTRLKR